LDAGDRHVLGQPYCLLDDRTMQGIHQKIASIGLAGIAAATCLLTAPNSALALTEQQILQKLNGIPVFLIVNDEGQSLTASVTNDEQEFQVPIVFINSAEAEEFIANAENEQTALTGDAQIAILPLSEVYAEANQQLEGAESLVYIPSAESVNQAAQIVDQEVQGVPLYAAVDLENDRYLLTGDNTLPMFFSLQDLQSQVSNLVASNPEIEDSIGVEVTTFETILGNMAADNPDVDQVMELIQFVPSSQTLQYLQNLSEQAAPAE
jgi:nickel transport protein